MRRFGPKQFARIAVWLSILASALTLCGSAWAGEMEDRVRNVLAPPAAIIAHAELLHLSLKQRTVVIRLGDRYQARVQRLQADILESSERLVEALESDPIEKTLALAELAKINAAEAEIKRLHLDLWIEANAQLRPLQRKHAIELSKKDDARGKQPAFD